MTKSTSSKQSPPPEELSQIAKDRRREWRFNLPLDVVVEGTLPDGNIFQEQTKLENISSTGAFFGLDSAVTIGSKLTLIIDLPEKITEGDKTLLRLIGNIVRLKKIAGEKNQGIALVFVEEYEFLRDEPK